MDNNRLAVIGDYDSIYGFASIGLVTFPVKETSEARSTLRNVIASEYEIIYITENTIPMVADIIEKYKDKVSPAIITIPGVSGNTGIGLKSVRQSVEKAVGSDILFGKD